MKAGQLKVNLTDSLTTKMAGLGDKLQIPRLGPEPALAGVGGRGASHAFDVTPGSKAGASSTSVAARVDDAASAGSRPTAGGAADSVTGRGGSATLHDGADPQRSSASTHGEAAAHPDLGDSSSHPGDPDVSTTADASVSDARTDATHPSGNPEPAGTRDLPLRELRKTYDRPSHYRVGVRDAVFDAAKGPDDLVRDPLTGRTIAPDKPWDMGHRPGYEFRKHANSACRRGIERSDFLDEHNDPSHYQPELPTSNQSHAGEDVTDTFLGP